MSKARKKKTVTPAEDAKIKDFLDMIAPGIIKFNVDHFICGNTFRCVWVLREYPTSTDEQAILRHLGEKDGVTLRIYTRQVTAGEEKKIFGKRQLVEGMPLMLGIHIGLGMVLEQL